ncbi:MAG: hypothetical protein G3M70_02445 [Candidatus Nitronauta litoralis]|uniref:Uncharacterized protein n=1 Tax=Candidatus Nitronauta litoralis TaxID=2705533 RepID=A0A7T0BTS6_9BACT|nr:MAG: hypothetical protein G3M70_02445 [Candidatus Nitronauta litoralis]
MEETNPTPPEEATQAPTSNELEQESKKGFPEEGIPKEEEIDLNEMFPGEDQDLNDLFPEKELKTLLHKVHKSQKDLAKINDRFVDDTENVVPKTSSGDEETDPSS